MRAFVNRLLWVALGFIVGAGVTRQKLQSSLKVFQEHSQKISQTISEWNVDVGLGGQADVRAPANIKDPNRGLSPHYVAEKNKGRTSAELTLDQDIKELLEQNKRLSEQLSFFPDPGKLYPYLQKIPGFSTLEKAFLKRDLPQPE